MGIDRDQDPVMLTYRWTRRGNLMLVYEYEGGRRGHTYEGKPQGELGVYLKPIDGGRNAYSRVPYEAKHTNWFKMSRLPDYDYDAPTPIEPKARVGTRADTRADEPEPEPEVLDNSAHTGVQIKLII